MESVIHTILTQLDLSRFRNSNGTMQSYYFNGVTWMAIKTTSFIFETLRPFLPADFRPTFQNKRLLEKIVVPMFRGVDENVWDPPHLFAFNNKIFDLAKREFVEPSPDQYIRTTCGWDYDDTQDQTAALEQMITLWSEWFPNPEVGERVRAIFASILWAPSENVENKIYMLYGSGGNGKSTCMHYIQLLFGDNMFESCQSPVEMMEPRVRTTRGGKRIYQTYDWDRKYTRENIEYCLKRNFHNVFIHSNTLDAIHALFEKEPDMMDVIEIIPFENKFRGSHWPYYNNEWKEKRQALFMMLTMMTLDNSHILK